MDKKKRNWIIEVILIIATIVIANTTPPSGLDRNAMIFLGLMLWAIGNWIINLFPIYATGFIFLAIIVMLGILPFSTAFSTFSGTTFWLLIAIFSIGAAVQKTGLLRRLCLKLLSWFPPTYRGQILAMLTTGCIVAPLMPSTTAKVAIAGSFGTQIAELLGFEPKSKGMHGMWCAMYTGFCLLAPLWLTSTFWSYVVLGMLTEEEAAPFSFGGWFIAMLPWAIIMFVASFFIIQIMYKAEAPNKLSKEDIRKMTADIGPMSREEKITLVVLACCVVLWCLEQVIGISSVVTGLLGMSVLMITNIFTAKDLKNLNWPTMLYFGPVLAIATATKELGINDWIAASFGDSIGAMIANPVVMVLVVGVLIQLLHFILVSGVSCISILLAVLLPFLEAAGINPWFAGITMLCMAQPWYLRYENGNTIYAFTAAGGDEKLDWNATVPYCLVYHLVCLAALVISVGYWNVIGLM